MKKTGMFLFENKISTKNPDIEAFIRNPK
jgi:hypothetical protein